MERPQLVPTAIAVACGLRDTSDRDALAHLLDVLHQRQALLVLDNFEHLTAAAPLVSAILAAAPGLRMIVTSRARLRLAFLLKRDGGLLFVGDTCRNMPRMNYSIGCEDLAVGRRSLARAALRFAAVCFWHGRTLHGSAAQRFNHKWA